MYYFIFHLYDMASFRAFLLINVEIRNYGIIEKTTLNQFFFSTIIDTDYVQVHYIKGDVQLLPRLERTRLQVTLSHMLTRIRLL